MPPPLRLVTFPKQNKKTGPETGADYREMHHMRHLKVAVFLYLFWLLLSGHLDALLLAMGALSVGLVVWFLGRMDRVDGEPGALPPGPRPLGYLVWLMWCVVKSNIDVARRVWHPRLPIQPVWTRLDTRVSTPLEKTLYANSITLTPGTLTTEVLDDHFMIHSLTQEGIDELREGEMERRICRLGI